MLSRKSKQPILAMMFAGPSSKGKALLKIEEQAEETKEKAKMTIEARKQRQIQIQSAVRIREDNIREFY